MANSALSAAALSAFRQSYRGAGLPLLARLLTVALYQRTRIRHSIDAQRAAMSALLAKLPRADVDRLTHVLENPVGK